MKAPMWLIVLYYVVFAVAFSIAAIQMGYEGDDSVWLIWAATAGFMWVVTFKRFKLAETEGWTTRSVIIDQRAWAINRTSGYISFIYLMLFLFIGITGYLSWGFQLDPVFYMILGLGSAMFLFATLQIIQSLVR